MNNKPIILLDEVEKYSANNSNSYQDKTFDFECSLPSDFIMTSCWCKNQLPDFTRSRFNPKHLTKK